MITISIISPRVSLEAIDRVIETRHFDCTFHKYVYHNLEEIEELYYQCKDDCDVIFCSGELGYHYLMKIKDLNKPCTFVSYEDKHFLLMALDFVIQHPDIPLNRVYCDFLTPLNQYLGMKQYLKHDYMPYCAEDPEYTYETLLSRAKELWESGDIDMVLTRSTNRLNFFKEHHIPFLHILPTDGMIAESINNAINLCRLNLKAEHFKACVVIKLEYPEQLSVQEQEYRQITFYKYLLDFRKKHCLNFSVQTVSNRFQLSADAVSETAYSDEIKKLIDYLNETENVQFRLGAGISSSEDQSLYQAESALHESIRYGKNDGFLMGSGALSMTGPFSLSHPLNYSCRNAKAAKYSRQNGIDEGNLLKITGLFTMNPHQPLTAASLSQWLNITPRSCNRILQQLLSSRLIEESRPQKAGGKGRPARQYQFVEENCLKTLF